MNNIFRNLKIPAWSAILGTMLLGPASADAIPAASPGIVKLTATLNDFVGSSSATSGQRHDVVAWVTKADGTFIKTLWKQGPAEFDHEDWVDHFTAWNTARADSTALDGFTGATSQTYAATVPNNPVSVSWNCRDASNTLVEDGDYKFYIQYAESKTNSGVPEQGPVTSALTWTKGTAPLNLTPPNEGTYGSPVGGFNFTNLSIQWIPGTEAPSITSAAPTATGSQGTPYSYTCTAIGSDPIVFSVGSGALPTGLTLTPGGLLSGTPLVAGTFTGTISASNGVLPNAAQPFSIEIAQAIVFTSAAPPSNGNLASPYTHSCTVIGTAPVMFSVASGMLPPGLTLSSDGLISGTPTEIGTYSGAIKAHNGIAEHVMQDFSITISLSTPGSVTLAATISEYTGTTSTTSPSAHFTAAWVTDAAGKFVKTLWLQGPAFSSKEWADHLTDYKNARGSNTSIVDGYSSATATSYATPVNNPIAVTWDCKDANGNLVDDGDYNFFIQYSESHTLQGPVTSALTWTKGLDSMTVNPPAQGSMGAPVNGFNFTDMSIVWTSGGVYTPEIVVQEPLYATLLDGSGVKDFGSHIIDTTGVAKTYTIKNVGTSALSGLGVYLYGTDAADYSIVTPPGKTTLAPWESTSFSVVFTPSAEGTRSASLQIVSNDADESPFDIQLTGTGTLPPAPEIDVMQPANSVLKTGTAMRRFGSVKIDSKTGKTLTFTIKNSGDAPLTGLKLANTSFDKKAFIIGTLSTTSLAPGASTTFDVTFKPNAKGARYGGVRIKSNDANESPFEIKLGGNGVK